MESIELSNTLQLSQKRFIEVYFENNGNISKTCEDIGISRSTYYNWIKEEDFKEQLNLIEDIKVDYVETKLFDLIDKGNVTAIIFYLNNKGKRRGYNIDNFEGKEYEPPKITIILQDDKGNLIER